MPEPQQLQIKISVSDTEALRKLNGLITRVGKLREAVEKIPTGSISTVTTNINTLTQALQTLASTGTGNLEKVGEAIKGLFRAVASSELSADAETATANITKLTKLAEGVSGFSSGMGAAVSGGSALSFLNDAVKQFASLPEMDMEHATNALTNLSKAVGKASESSGGLEKLASGLVKIPNAIKKFDIKTDYTDKIASIKTTLDGLAVASEKAKSVGTGIHGLALGLKTLPKALEKFGEASQYTDAIREVAKALYLLAPAVEQVSTVGNNIHNLATGIKTLPKALEGIGKAKDYKTNIQQLAILLEQIKEAFSGFGSNSNGSEAIKSIRAVLTIIKALSKLGADGNLSKNFQTLSNTIKEFVVSLNEITDEQTEKVYNLGVGLKSLVDASRGLEKAQDNLKKMSSTKWADVLKGALKDLGSELKKFPKRVKTALTWIAKLAYMPIKPLVNGINKITHAFTRFLHSATRIALYRLIRSGLRMITQGAKEGIDNLYKWGQLVGNDFVPTMDHLASEFLYLKNSVGAALSPVIQALEPVITNIIHKFVELLNVFNQFIAMMSGKDTYRRAVYYATTYGEALEDSLDGAGKSAKELQNILMDFDQLNLITTPKDRNSGSGADDDKDYGLMFEVVDVDKSLFDWLQSADWSKFGYDLAEKISNALEGINWEAFREKGISFAKKLSSFLNGVFENEGLFSNIGDSIAEAINTAATTINTFVYGTNWEKLGNDLAEALKKFLKKLDPGELGKAMASGGVTLAGILHGFVEKMSADDWKRLANKIYWTFSMAMTSIPWETLIPDLVELTTGFVQAVTAALKGLASAKTEIEKGVANADWASLRQALADLIGALCKDIPVIPIILTFSIGKVAFSAASKLLAGKLFASAVAKALGGTVATGGAGAAGEALAGAGAGAISAALPYIAVGLGVVFTIWASWNWAEDKVKDLKKTATNEAPKATELDKVLNINNKEYHYQGVLDSRVQDALTKLDEYKRKLEVVGQLITPQHLGLANTKENVQDLSKQLDNLAKALDSDDPYAVARAAERVGEMFNKVGGNFEATGKGIIKTYEDVENTSKSNVDKALANLDKLKENGNITLIEYTTLRMKLLSGVEKDVKEALRKIKDTLDEAGNNLKTSSFNWGSHIAQGIARGIYENQEKATAAAWQMYSNIKRVMAFSEPKEGPLSDFHTYMPDMLDLMAQGIRENAYKVENEVTSLAGRMSKIGSMAVDASVSASLNGQAPGMADEIYDANSEERALLRELINAVKDKQLVVSPSASLGKVVNQSSRLYAGVTG